MSNLGKLAAAVGGIVIITAAGLFLAQNGADNKSTQEDGGIDVGNTPCEGLAAARTAVDEEYKSRMEKADSDYRETMETASDNYWEKYRETENAKQGCETNALLADPCREHFERASALAKEIMDNIDQGYDEAKSAERDQAKSDYDECMKNPPEEDTYEGKKAKCEADFKTQVDAAQAERDAAESAASSAEDSARAKAEEGKTSKHATLDAIAEICNIPPPETTVTAGEMTTGGTGTVVESGNPACTGKFTGHDPEIQAEISRLQQLLAQARAGGKTEGLGGTNQLSAKITQLMAEMAAGPRKCSGAGGCGDTTKVCCSETQVGWVVCNGGECGTEKEDCEDEAICSGKPASCVSGAEGAESSAIEISRTFIKGATCNPNLQKISLQPKDENSARFEITGQIPEWLKFDQVGGQLPQDVTISIDCNITKTEGTYTGSASVTIYDKDDNLINTIPINVTIEVVASILEEDDDEMTAGGDIDLTDPGEATTNDPEDVVIPPDEAEEVVTTGGDVELTEPEPEPTTPKVSDREYGHDELAKMTQEEIRALGDMITISALSYGGNWFPFPGSQFVFCMSCPPMCEGPHYHGGTGLSLDLETVPQPPYSNCYWGTDIKSITATPDKIINWFHNK